MSSMVKAQRQAPSGRGIDKLGVAKLEGESYVLAKAKVGEGVGEAKAVRARVSRSLNPIPPVANAKR